MSVIVNLRNNTSLFIKVNGIDEVIVPNTSLEDKTIQWVSTENKTIQFFNEEGCSGPAVCQGSLNFITNDGIFVDRGNFTGAQLVKMYADVDETPLSVEQVDNNGGGKLLEWSEINSETIINLSFFNI